MIELVYIVAFAIAVCNVLKVYLVKPVVPFAAIGLTIGFNLLNAYLFGGDFLDAGREAFIAGGIAVGLFVAGDKVGKKVA